MTTLTATPLAASSSNPAGVTLVVAGAPSVPALAYSSNFATTDDGWTGSAGTYVLNASEGAPANSLEVQGAVGASTFSRTVAGLTIGHAYTYSLYSSRIRGTMALAVTGMTVGAFMAPATRTLISYTFTATATSHTIEIRTQGGGGLNAVYDIDTVAVQDGSWKTTTITRTDANGTNVPVRNPARLDTPAGTMTLVDYEPAMVGTVTYTATDGAGGTATATTAINQTETRRNLATNPSFEINTSGWGTSGGATTALDTIRAYSGAQCCKLTHAAGAANASILIYTLAGITIGQQYTAGVRVWIPTGGVDHALRGTGLGGGTATTTRDAWALLTFTFTATATTHTLYVGATTTTTAGALIWVDALIVEVGSGANIGTYFDGDTRASGLLTYQWVGTAHASVSVQLTTGAPMAPSLTLPATGAPPSFATLTAATDYAETSQSPATVHVVLGRSDKLSNPGTLLARNGTLELWCPDYPAATAVRTLLRNATVALFRQGDYPGLDLYFVARTVDVAPAEPTLTRHWLVTVTYDEVPRP